MQRRIPGPNRRQGPAAVRWDNEVIWVPFTFTLLFVTVGKPTSFPAGPRFMDVTSHRELIDHVYEVSPD
jgi:hypothetical protein